MREPQHYDAIGRSFERIKELPVGIAEQATVFAALGPLRGKSVLDVGCGSGFYPRRFRQAGAVRVVGVDSSRVMISWAQHTEEHDPLGISYELHDAETLPRMGSFDVVTAIWLLGYAEGEDVLERVVRNLLVNLVDGGLLLALIPNPEIDWDHLAAYRLYGLSATKTVRSSGRQACVMHVEGDPPFDFESFHWPPGVLDGVLERAGLSEITRHPAQVGRDALADRGEAYWAPLLANPTFAVFSARKP